jgi:hypothetical protein
LVDGRNDPVEVLGRNAPRVVVLLHVVGKAVDQDESVNPLRMGDREMDRPSARCLPCHQRRMLESYGVEHGSEVRIEDTGRS